MAFRRIYLRKLFKPRIRFARKVAYRKGRRYAKRKVLSFRKKKGFLLRPIFVHGNIRATDVAALTPGLKNALDELNRLRRTCLILVRVGR